MFFLHASLMRLLIRLRSTALLKCLLGTVISTLTGMADGSAGVIRNITLIEGTVRDLPVANRLLTLFMPQSLSLFLNFAASFFMTRGECPAGLARVSL